MKKLIALSALLAVAPFAQAADVAAGKARAEAVCAACHGANGVSVSDNIPTLPGSAPATSRTSSRRSRTACARTR